MGAHAQQAVQTSPAPLACLLRSGTIATAGVAQQALGANPLRRGFVLQAPASGSRLTFTTAGTAGATSVELQPGASFVSPEWGAVTAPLSIWSAVAGAPFALEECF